MIREEEVELAVEWLRDNARPAAKAKAERIYMEEFRKSLEAELMQEAPEVNRSDKARESWARSHPRYVAHLQAIRAAVESDEAMRWLMVAAQAKIEAWRTQNANLRAEGRAYS